jgi:hypothetical protein
MGVMDLDHAQNIVSHRTLQLPVYCAALNVTIVEATVASTRLLPMQRSSALPVSLRIYFVRDGHRV